MSTPPPGDRRTPDATGQPSATALLIQRHLSAPRLATYVRATGGDLDRAVELYLWNAAVAGALWEVLGHVEVVLRNLLHDALTARHQRLARAGQWYDDPIRELSQHARDDITRARQRLQRAGAPLLPGKIVAELGFGFWRFLLARRYTASLWPALRPAFPYLPGSDRRLLEAPVARLHVLRNRVAHHEPLLTVPLGDRHTDLLDVVGFVHPRLRSWLDTHNRLLATLARRP
jgi:hypothetical protein